MFHCEFCEDGYPGGILAGGSVQTSLPVRPSIVAWLLHAIDNKNVHRRFPRFKLQPDLPLDGRKQIGAALLLQGEVEER